MDWLAPIIDRTPAALVFWALAVPPPAILAGRILFSLLSLVPLYRFLGYPPGAAAEPDLPQTEAGGHPVADLNPPRDRHDRKDVARRCFFAALGAFVIFHLTARMVPESGSPDTGRGFQSFVKGAATFRMSHSKMGEAAATSGPGKTAPISRGEAVADLRKGADLVAQSAAMHRYAGIALADQRDYRGALQQLERAADLLEQRVPDRARQERQLWSALFGAVPPAREQVDEAAGKIRGWGLGWIGDVAVLAAYQRVGAVPEDVARRVHAEASAWSMGVLSGAFLDLCMVPQLGLISLVVLGVLMSTGVLRRAWRGQHPIAPVLWEAFILMMALYLAPSFVNFTTRKLNAETQPGLIAAILVLSDVTYVIALGYLWWRLRRHRLGLAEIGLTRKHLGANVLLGAMAATVLTPLAFLVGYLTQAISDRFFPNVAPPYHPLNGIIATSSSIEIRTAMFIMAAVSAPLFEEIFFRGALFGALRRRWGLWPAILASGGFFAILHPQLPLGFLPLAVLGGAFAALYDWRQSLVPSMVAHAINNALAFLLLNLMFPLRG